MRNNSFDFISSFLNYFDFHTIRVALLKSGFANIHIEPVDPRRKADHKNSGYVRVLCRTVDIRKPPLLSVIVPVYNEKPTFSIMMDQLLKKDIKGLEKEIIIVESNSSDGTKDDVDRYKNIPGVTVIYEDKPRGKGHAVRTGFKHAKGDYFIIQDGDLEYDINDYELLLEPLLSGKAVFVLGSRHGESWKIRKYKKIFLPYIMNLAHWALVGIMNIFYRQSMSDPFTMYKVFHRDCLYGLQFECDRFNFDIELVCKLLRKGYTPYEVTVNYKSRHFSEGKKVKFFRDPPTWIKAIIKYRIVQVYFPFMNPKGKEV
ncbi:glycosyltransferase family 2 protein [candidate division KSB1 bacterium]|nr:glycosyltransferase family 2 protein [candidate division KSB1 bacterium]